MNGNSLKCALAIAVLGTGLGQGADIVFNEIMFHPPHILPAAEDQRAEWLELHNQGTNSVNLQGWRIARGIDFPFPAVSLPPGGYLVVAADLSRFQQLFPSVTNVVGGWQGTLANNNNRVALIDSFGLVVDELEYADSGDWGQRERGGGASRVASIVRNGNTATVTVFAHGYSGSDQVRISGADQPEYNGIFSLSSIGASTFNIVVAGTPATPASGNIVCRHLYDNGYSGWSWFSAADGFGSSLELVNSALPSSHGQNWRFSSANNGTPGARNSVATNNAAPLVLEVRHFPPIPRSTEAIAFTARPMDEQTAGLTVRLFYRDASLPSPPGFSSLQMFDDGTHGDSVPADGLYTVAIAPQFNNTVIEYYVQATDGGGLSRTWPAPALDGNGQPVQGANALLQVDDSVYTGNQPIHRLIMTETERAEFAGMPTPRNSDAEMNTAFISVDAAGTVEVRQRCGVRARGAGSRGRTPPNMRLNFPRDARWKGYTGVNLNVWYSHVQYAGYLLSMAAGLPIELARIVQVRVNNANLAAGTPSYGCYIEIEPPSSDFPERHWPNDSDGNLYRASSGGHSADLTYQGTNPDNYVSRGYQKSSNVSRNDWSDLINLTYVLNNTPSVDYVEAVGETVNLEQWMLYFAMFSFMDSRETSLGTGRGDDYSMYRGVRDSRFQLLAHDLDTILGQGDTAGNPTENIFRAGALPVVNTFLRHPELVPMYFKTLTNLAQTVFAPENINPLLDYGLRDFVPQTVIDSMKDFAALRRASILSQVPTNFSVTTTLPVQNGYPYATTSAAYLYGDLNAISTRSVLVKGQPAVLTPDLGRWTASSVPLNPGVNRVLVQWLDAEGDELARRTIDVYYNAGAGTNVFGNLSTNATWTAAGGPYNVTGNLTIDAGATLTIEPGASVFFYYNTRMDVNGRLLVNGSSTNRVRFTALPGAGTDNFWAGLNFYAAGVTSRISHADIEFAGSASHSVHVNNGILLADNLSFSGTTRTLIELTSGSLHVRDSVFPNIVGAEHIHGGPVPANGFVIIERNLFGTTTGLNDIIDFTGGQRPGPILQVLGNIFTAASDDILDLDGTDALIEGNIFMNVRHDPNTSPDDTASAVSGGSNGGVTSELTIVRNLFYNCEHAVLCKEGNFYTIVNNTIVGSTQGAINFDEPGRRAQGVTPGLGAYLDGNIIWNCPSNFANVYVNDPTFGTTLLTVNRSILSDVDFPTNGVDNLSVDPLLNNVASNYVSYQTLQDAFGLRSGSPALGTGPNGLDMGALVPAGASISGEPEALTVATNATLTVGGPGIVEYRWSLNNAEFSNPVSVTNPIVLTGLTNGAYRVKVVGGNYAGVWQSTNFPGRSQSWTVTNEIRRLIISEVLAQNRAYLRVGDNYPDLVELHNAGSVDIDLGGMVLADDFTKQQKFIFPPGVILPAGQYLVLYADNSRGPGWHLGFALNAQGDDLYLFDNAAQGNALLDSVTFGVQLPDLSIGRRPSGEWELGQPTFGGPNVQVPTGDGRTLKINEWLARPQTKFGYDFIEIYNPEPVPVNLGGWFLTDFPPGDPTKFRVAPLSFVSAYGYRVFIADGQTNVGGDHVNFALAAESGLIGLSDARGNLIDMMIYGPQVTDFSEGRSPNGAGNIALFNQPTPGSPNPGSTSGTNVITSRIPLLPMSASWRYFEFGPPAGSWWLTNYNDSSWVSGPALLAYETCNCLPPPGTNTVLTLGQMTYYFRTTFTVNTNLSGYTLSLNTILDDGAVIYLNGVELMRWRMPPGPVDHNTQAANTPGSNASVEYFDGFPASLLNQGVNYLAVEVHQSSAGSSDVVWGMSLEATRQITNLTQVSVMLNEVLANNSVYTNEAAQATDYVEFHNPSTNTVDLSGLGLTDDPYRPYRWVFPNGTGLAPGGYLVVDCNGNALASDSNTGFGLNTRGGSVYLYDRASNGGGLLGFGSVTYGLQIRNYSIGRVADGEGTRWALTVPTRAAENVATPLGDPMRLRINEWMPNDTGGNDDWFELFNPEPLPVELGGLFVTDNLLQPYKHRIHPLSFIGTGAYGFVQFKADRSLAAGPEHVDFRLDNTAESIGLYWPNFPALLVDSINYSNVVEGVSQGRFADGASNIVSFMASETPGAANFLPLPGLVINEVLAHSESPFENAIEVRNTTDFPYNLGGWYLSNAEKDLKRYRIPLDTLVPPGGFVVFYAYQFDPPSVPPNVSTIQLDWAEGDQVYLSEAILDGQLTGYRTSQDFRPSPSGVSLGRYETSVDVEFTALSEPTFGLAKPVSIEDFRTGTGAANAYPLVGPVVISEVVYHPPDIGTNDNQLHEFIELVNISGDIVQLHDPLHPTNVWRLKDAVDFYFPTNLVLAPGEHLLVVSFDPIADTVALQDFLATYPSANGAVILGPYGGKLDNSSESVELARPGSPLMAPSPDAGLVPYFLVDKVKYRDEAPWPILADGGTNLTALSRVSLTGYGNDPTNWWATLPTPGAVNSGALLTAPAIAASPLDTNVIVGGSVTLEVAATGDAPLGYQWFFNKLPLAGQTNASLVLSNVQIEQAGRYGVVAYNPAASAASADALLTVDSPPLIAQQPQSQVVLAGETASFFVSAAGADLSYQWRLGGQLLADQTNSMLVLTNVQLGQAGNYDVVVGNLIGYTTSALATLTVWVAPFITAEPADLTVVLGQTASLSVAAEGTLPLGFQWHFNGAPISGATGANLVLTNAQPNLAGGYQVVVSNVAGTVTSRVAELTVFVPPTVTVSAPVAVAYEVGQVPGEFVFTRTGPPTNNLVVQFLISGAAMSGSDYLALPMAVIIPVGASSTNLVVMPINDIEQETDEPVVIVLQSSPEYLIGSPASAVVTIVDDDNLPPVITLVSPTNDQFFPHIPTNVTVQVNASDPEGNLAHVAFYLNGARFGQADTAPYGFVLPAVPSGTNVLLAVAVDSLGTTNAASLIFRVNHGPQVAITQPLPGSQFLVGSNVTITASATDLDGSIASVQFFVGSNPIAVVSNAPYSTVASNLGPGQYQLTAVAADNYGIQVTSPAVNITMLAPVQGLVDDFEPGIDLTQWSVFGGVVGADVIATNYGGAVSGVNSLWFGGDSERYARTRALNTLQGGLIAFYLRIAGSGGSQPWEQADLPGEGVVLEYSLNGSTWVNVATYDTEAYNQWTLVSMGIPPGASGTNVFFRWRQLGHSGDCCDHWALDDVQITIGPTPPTIFAQPANVTTIGGGDATFMVSAAGSQPMYYQWLANGTNILGATDDTLLLSNVNTNMSGWSFSVIASNAYGTARSSNAILTVVEATGDTFQIISLTTNRPRVIDVNAVTSDDRGGIAVSGTRVFLTGDGATAHASASDLSGPVSLGRRFDGLIGDLRTETVYTLGLGGEPIGNSGGNVTSLLEINGNTGVLTGSRINLSSAINVPSYNVGLFSGFGRIVIFTGSRAYSISVPSGVVVDLGAMQDFNHQSSENWAYWGVAEYSGGNLYIVYVENSQTIVRRRVPDGLRFEVLTLGSSGGLGDMASITVSPSRSRWYFHYESYSPTFGSYSESLGYADAYFQFGGNVPPFIVDHPQSHLAALGGSTSFQTLVSGSTPLAYQWYFNGSPISGATQSTLTIANALQSDEGDYFVVVTNSSGSATSSVASLTIGAAPIFITQPESTELLAGMDLELSGEAIGAQPIFYWWQYNGNDILEFTNSVLTLTNAQWYFTGNFTLVASNELGAVTSQVAEVTVLSPPVILTQPAGERVDEGSSFALTVELAGTEPFDFQWYKNDRPLPGATTNAYEIPSVDTNTIGDYYVVIENDFGMVTSAVAAVGLTDLTIPGTFRILSLQTNNSRVIRHDLETGDDRGAIAVSGSHVFYTGDNTTARYNLDDLSEATPLNSIYQGLVSNLRRGTLYSLGNGANMINNAYEEVNTLIELDPVTLQPSGHIINLSQAFTPNYGALICAGYDRVALWDSSYRTVYDIDLRDGTVTTYGSVDLTPYSAEDWAEWGVAEFYDNEVYLVYRSWSGNEIVRTRASDGRTTVVASFQNLAQMAAFTVSIGLNRWYFEHEGISEFTGNSFTGDALGYADATFLVVTESNAPPHLWRQPFSQRVIPGSSIDLVVSVDGAAPFDYQWFFNGQSLPGATSDTFSILSVGENTIGDYFVVVTNAFGVATSTVATVGIIEFTPDTFRILTLETTRSRVVDHNSLTGDDRGGIAVSDTHVFYSGDNRTVGYLAADLTGGTGLGQQGQPYDSLVSDLRSGTVYSLGNGANIVNGSGQTVNSLIELNGTTLQPAGRTIPLSRSFTTSYSSLLCAGYSRIVYWDSSSSTVYDIKLPSGTVATNGPVFISNLYGTENWAAWGVAEFYDGQIHLVYRPYGNNIIRTGVTDGQSGTVASFSSISDLAAFTVSRFHSRWYFHYEGSGQFGGSSETLGYADATFLIGPQTNDPPFVLQQPLSQDVKVSSTLRLEATVIGTPPMFFQWQRDGAAIPGATNEDLVIPNIQLDQGGGYRFVVSNAFGASFSDVAFVTVSYGYDTNRILLLSMTNVWRYNQSGNNLGTGWTSPTYSDTSWPTGRGLLGLEDNAAVAPYIRTPLSLTNSSGSSITTHYFRQRFIMPSWPEAVGYSLVTSNIVDDGAVFYLNGVEVGRTNLPSGFISSSTYATSAAPEGVYFQMPISTNSLTPSAANYLAVEVHQNSGTSSDVVFGSALYADVVYPIIPPSIFMEPMDQSALPGGYVFFSVSANGVSPLSFQWQLNGTNLPAGNTAVLVLLNVQLEQEGDYTAVVSNPYGTTTSRVARLTILRPPSIVAQPANQVAEVGANVALNVGVDGSTPLDLQWFKNSQILLGATNSLLSLLGVAPDDAGSYSLYASNSMGAVTSAPATVTVIGPQLEAPTFQSSNGMFRLDFAGPPDAVYAVEGSTNLIQWIDLGTVTNKDGRVEFLDTTSTNSILRFYRLRWIP